MIRISSAFIIFFAMASTAQAKWTSVSTKDLFRPTECEYRILVRGGKIAQGTTLYATHVSTTDLYSHFSGGNYIIVNSDKKKRGNVHSVNPDRYGKPYPVVEVKTRVQENCEKNPEKLLMESEG